MWKSKLISQEELGEIVSFQKGEEIDNFIVLPNGKRRKLDPDFMKKEEKQENSCDEEYLENIDRVMNDRI